MSFETVNAVAGKSAPPAPAQSGRAPASLLSTATQDLRARLASVLALLPALGFLLIVLSPPLNHDVAAVLDFSARMLAGERLYEDLIDVNPPLIFLLNLAPSWLAAATPLSPPQALLGFLLLFALASGGLAFRLAARRPEEAARGPVERAVLAAVLPLAILASGYDFGQREQIMATAALPYLFLAERRIEGARTPLWLALPAVLMAALGFALKPHFLAVPALVEGVVLLAARRGPAAGLRDPVPWLMAALWALYLAGIAVFFPAYFGHVVPLVRDWYLDLGGGPWWRVLLTPATGTAALLALALLAFAALAGRVGWMPRLLAAAVAGGMLAALVQHKGWSYHLVPAWCWGGLALALLLSRWADAALPQAEARRAAPFLAAGVSVALALFALRGDQAPWIQFNYAESRGGRLAEWLRREAPGQRVLVLSPDIPGVYPAVNYAESRLMLPFMSTWVLQATYATCAPGAPRYREPWAMSRAEFLVFRTVAERFSRTPPKAVVVSRWAGIPPCNGEFDLVSYFRRHPRFAEAWQSYRPRGEIDGYLLFTRED